MARLILCGLACALAGGMATTASAATGGEWSGNINVISQYVLRGITQTYNGYYDGSGPESSGPAVQGGLDYTHENGFYAGYWFSSIGYSYADLNPERSRDHVNSVENDFYAGYNGKLSNGLSYTLGGTLYYYLPGWNSTGLETKVGVGYGNFSFTAQTLLNDVTFGNQGDTYWLASYTHELPRDFTFNGQIGYYSYGKDGKYIPEVIAANPGGIETVKCKSGAFRHVTLGVSHPLPIKGASASLQYLIGGENRYGVKQDNTMIASVGFKF